MKFAKETLAALVLGFVSISAFSTGAPQEAAPYSTTSIKRTFVLTPGSSGYKEWKAWIDRENAAQPTLRRADGTSQLDGAGRVTVTIRSETTAMSAADVTPVPPDRGPPMPLPVNGTPGQEINITSQTYTVYQEWSFTWSGSAVDGSWVQTAYYANSCEFREGFICPRGI